MKKNEGFTIIELIIAIGLAGLIFLASSSLMFAIFSSNTRVHQLDQLEQTKTDFNFEFSNAIRWSKQIEITSDGTLLITDQNGLLQTYALKNGALTKNDSPLHTADVTITSFLVQDYSQNSTVSQKSILITIELQHKTFNAVKETMRIVASQRYAT